MIAVFKAQGHTFVRHLCDTFDRVFIIKQRLPYGLTEKDGEIAISPKGYILGWRFEGDEQFETWRLNADIAISLYSKDNGCSCIRISGTTKTATYQNRQWELAYMVHHCNSWVSNPEDSEWFDNFEDAIARANESEWENVEILKADEAYQS